MSQSNFVSILTVTFNHSKYIAECVESVLSQTYDDWEMVIVDDGSTDGTIDIIKEYNDSKIKIISKGHKGLSGLAEAYNLALAESNGDLVAILEGDDYWPPNKLEKQITSFERDDVVLSFGMAGWVNNDHKTIGLYPREMSQYSHWTQKELLSAFLKENFMTACTVMIRKSALAKIGGFKQIFDADYVDYPTWMELFSVGDVRPLEDVLGYWRRHENQTSIMKSISMAESSKKIALSYFRGLSPEKMELLNTTEEELLEARGLFLADVYFTEGRWQLLDEKWSKAQSSFLYAMFNGRATIRILSIVGLLFTVIHCNFEIIARAFNRRSLLNISNSDKK